MDRLSRGPIAEPGAGASERAVVPTQTRFEPAVPKVKLGEELPVFCERCGYSLHGLPQSTCQCCEIRQFTCPECGHHQPINTLRPAFHKLLGRIRAFFLSALVFFKINIFGWILVGWVAMGFNWSYEYDYFSRSSRVAWYRPRALDREQALAFALFALFFGMLGRMLLLRWRRGILVGAVLSAIVLTMIVLGAAWRKLDSRSMAGPFTDSLLCTLGLTAAAIMAGASTVWWIWLACVYMLLPRRAGQALLEWQKSQSEKVADLARQ